MANLADIRARLAAQDNRQNKKQDGEGPVYPHWNIDEGATAIVRFIEDGDTANPYFWVERAMFKFPFIGVKGDPTSKNVIVQIPCMEMYDEKDPVLDEVRTWFKDPAMEEMGRKYWKKRTFLYQGFVRSDPMNNEAPENPIRRFMISPQIHNLIKNSLMDPEIEKLPTDNDAGLDFRIQKQTKGGYADYTSSTWARKETALTDEELAAIEQYGKSDIKTFLPPKPTDEVLAVIREIFEASVDGEEYDLDRWGKYFTPNGMANPDTNPATTPATTPVTETVTETVTESAKVVEVPAATVDEKETVTESAKVVEVPAATVDEKETVTETVAESAPASDNKAQDILAMIRNRQK